MTLVTDSLVNQSEFMSRIRQALGKTDAGGISTNLPPKEAQNHIGNTLAHKRHNRSLEETAALIEQLRTAAAPLNIHVIQCDTVEDVADSITDMARSKPPEWSKEPCLVAWAHPLVDALELENSLKDTGVTCHREWCGQEDGPSPEQRQEMHLHASEALMGITSADVCIAGTATLVLTARKGQSRSTSLLPSIHVAVIKASQLIEDIKELHAILQWDENPDLRGPDRSLTLISGPSKTADIEATMIHGVHGPRELYIYVISNS